MRSLLKTILATLTLVLFVSQNFTSLEPAQAAITAPSSPSSSTSTPITIGSTSMISGYSGDIRVIVTSSNVGGKLSITSTSGLTRVSGYDNSSALTTAGDQIAFEGSVANANTALASLRYQGTTVQTDTISMKVESAGYSSRVVTEDCDGDGNPEQCFHYYKAVRDTFRTWEQARQHTIDQSQTVGSSSVKGWLATITSSEENTFVSQYVSVDSWIGATDRAVEGDWAWVDNSEPTVKNKVFWRGVANGSTQNGLFARWSSGEPNEWQSYQQPPPGEDYAQFLQSGYWNDLGPDDTQSAYIWETTSTTDLLSSETISFSVAVYAPPTNTVAPVASGTATFGQTLTTTEGSWSDNGQAITSTATKWQRYTGSAWADIPSATSSAYVLQSSDVGKTVRSAVSTTNIAGTTVAFSAATAVVAPMLPTDPSISGIAAGNGQVTVSFLAPTSNGGGAISGYHYSLDGGTTWVTNANIITSPFVVSNLTNGTSYSIKIRAVNSAGPGPASSEISVTPFGPPLNSTAPTITQTPRVGELLSYSAGVWSENGSVYTTISQQWQRNTGIGWVNITGATSSGYTVSQDDLDAEIRVLLTRSNVAGTTVVPSGPTGKVLITAPDKPVISSITAGVGQISFTAVEGPLNGGSSARLEYSLDGQTWVTLELQTSNRYVIDGLVAGQEYTILVRATNSAGSSQADTAVVGTPTSPPPTNTQVVTINPGTNAPGSTRTNAPVSEPSSNTASVSVFTPQGTLTPEARSTISAPVSIPSEILTQLFSASGSPTQILVDEAGRPDLSPMQTIALIDGEPVTLRRELTSASDGIALIGPDFSIQLSLPGGQVGADLSLDFTIGMFADLSVTGFAPGQPIYIWLFSEPSELGFVTADENGNYKGKVQIPESMEPGSHTLQVNGVSQSGEIRTVALGVTLNQEVPTPTSNTSNNTFDGALVGTFALLTLVILLIVVFLVVLRRRRA